MSKLDSQTAPLADLWSSRASIRESRVHPRFTALSCLALAAAIFLLDRVLMPSIPVNALYVIVLFLSTRLHRPQLIWIGILGCTGAILLDLALSLGGADSRTLFFSNGIALFILWWVGWVLWTQSKAKSDNINLERQSDSKIEQLTRQLGETRVQLETSLLKKRRAEQELTDLNHSLNLRNQELETIVSVTSHDLRSPLVNVQGFGKELAKSCGALRELCEKGMPESAQKQAMLSILEEDIPESLHYIQAGTGKIDTLLRGVLRLAGLGRLTLRHELLNMNEMMAEIVAGMEFQLKHKHVSIRTADLPPCLGDATLINQLFCNLLDNACKYLDPSRPGLIQVRGTREGDWSTYTVKDNGLGIDKENQDKIFDMFYRIHHGEFQGEGLGLTIVKRIIDRHQGTITLESTSGIGTSFAVSLLSG